MLISLSLGILIARYSLEKRYDLRQRFEQQLDIFITPISEVALPTKSRDELPPTLKALQYIFVTPAINEKIFLLLEQKFCAGKKKTGRPGMDLWHILVLAVIRHTLNTDWDRLTYISNYDLLVRSILGVHRDLDNNEFEYQNILDNVSKIDEQMLQKINDIVVEAGQQLVKNNEPLHLKTDSYALETNVHFPTDLNLLWDSCRKSIDTVLNMRQCTDIAGWRKIKDIRKTLKSQFRATSHQVFKGKNEAQKKKLVKQYLQQAKVLEQKCDAIFKQTFLLINPKSQTKIEQLLANLKSYNDYNKLFSNQIERRILKGIKIPADEKIYSIFEPYSNWISKGKAHKKVEMGELLLITTDQYQYIVDYKIMFEEKDATQIPSLLQRIETKYKFREIYSHSFDKGFWSKNNWDELEASKIQNPVLPKRGKYSKSDVEREASKGFKQLRNKHSAVESNINMLEHHGLGRCKDKGITGFKRCVGLSILAYNLHIMGNQLQAIEKAKEKKRLLLLRKLAA